MLYETISLLSNKFVKINLNDLVCVEIDSYIKDFPHADIKNLLKKIPTRFDRWWMTTCINGHLRKVRKLRKLVRSSSNLNNANRIISTHKTALLWILQAQRMVEYVNFIHENSLDQSLEKYYMEPQNLKLGDVVLSYKTKFYLKHSFLSLFIKFLTNSSITHVMVSCSEDSRHPELLMSDDTTNGLGLHPGIPDKGELLIVMETLPNNNLEKVKKEILRLRTVAIERSSNRLLYKAYRFPEKKCELACIIGLLYISSSVLFRFAISIKNPFRNISSGTFCSELVDSLFMNSGIQLLARSENAAVVGPVELLYSPHLRIKGIIGDKNDIMQAKIEVKNKFLIRD